MKGLEEMTAEEGRAIIAEIMGAWDKYRALWIKRFGNEAGFGDWFLKQTEGRRIEKCR